MSSPGDTMIVMHDRFLGVVSRGLTLGVVFYWPN